MFFHLLMRKSVGHMQAEIASLARAAALPRVAAFHISGGQA
jgi:hypothetical protein